MIEQKISSISEETAENLASAFSIFDVDLDTFNAHFKLMIDSYKRIINAEIATKGLMLAVLEMKKSDSRFFKWYYQIKINKLKKQLDI